MKFSVIVPIYNISSYIDQCVESIVNQTYKNIEIILVNDGSTDDSLNKIKEWEERDRRIIVVDKPNGGLSDARNAGLKIATGDYVSFVDGDDWIDQAAIMTGKDFIENNGSVDMLCFDYWEYYSQKVQRHISYTYKTGIFSGPDFFERSSFRLTAWSKFYNKQFLLETGLLFLKGRVHEDLSYTVPMCNLAENVGYIAKPLYYYRQNRDNSIMSSVSYKNVLDFSHALCFDYYILKKNHKLSDYLKRWIMRGFYKACFTGQTDFKTLRKAFKANNVARIAVELNEGNFFWMKLYFFHNYMKTRTFLGVVKQFTRDFFNVKYKKN